jgi:hypothetical protein
LIRQPGLDIVVRPVATHHVVFCERNLSSG